MSSREEGSQLMLDFNKLTRAAANSPGLIPVAVQDADSGEVILVAYTNEQAFREAVVSRTAVFWSSSRNMLWEKGKSSGNMFDLVEVYVNCEQNSLLYKVRARKGRICHTRNKAGEPRNCFYRRVNMDTLELENLDP